MGLDLRRELAEWLLEQMGEPYVWGAKGTLVLVKDAGPRRPFDCSGLVTRGTQQVWRYPRTCPRCQLSWVAMHNAQRLWNELDELPGGDAPRELDLAFYGYDEYRVEHVMFVWGDGRVYGSTGGGRNDTDPALSLRKGAKVQFRSRPNYRPDLLGFRRLVVPTSLTPIMDTQDT